MSWNDWVVAIMKGCDSNSVVISAHNGGICGKSESLEFDRVRNTMYVSKCVVEICRGD